MPRANRYLTEGQYYHVTHRCHNRAFLLKYAKDRNLYRRMMRELLSEHPVHVLGYCLTSNHVHLLLTSDRHDAIGGFMQVLAGNFARAYNRRKGREDAFWSGRYDATLVDSESYLWNCLRYIDLNMVRAGVVSHPSDWDWCGYRELSGQRQRYRLLDRERLLEGLRVQGGFDRFQASYAEDVSEQVRAGALVREPAWTESLAVGRKDFVARMAQTIKNRRDLQMEERTEASGAWVPREGTATYA